MEALRQVLENFKVTSLALTAGVGLVVLLACMPAADWNNKGANVVVLLALVAHALLSAAAMFSQNLQGILPAVSCLTLLSISIPLMIKTVDNMAKHPKKEK